MPLPLPPQYTVGEDVAVVLERKGVIGLGVYFPSRLTERQCRDIANAFIEPNQGIEWIELSVCL